MRVSCIGRKRRSSFLSASKRTERRKRKLASLGETRVTSAQLCVGRLKYWKSSLKHILSPEGWITRSLSLHGKIGSEGNNNDALATVTSLTLLTYILFAFEDMDLNILPSNKEYLVKRRANHAVGTTRLPSVGRHKKTNESFGREGDKLPLSRGCHLAICRDLSNLLPVFLSDWYDFV